MSNNNNLKTEKMRKGLSVSVYKSPLCDSTANGTSSKFDRMVLLDIPNTPFEPNEDGSNALVLVKRQLFLSEYIHAEPLHKKSGMV